MPVETRSMKIAREAQGARGGNQTAATTAATTTTPAPRAPRKKAAGMEGAKGTKSKVEVKGRNGVGKVQESTKSKKGGAKAVMEANQKGKGKQVADETGKGDPAPGPRPGSEPEPKLVGKGKGKANGESRLTKGMNKIQKSTTLKKGGIRAVWEAKQKGKGKKTPGERT